MSSKRRSLSAASAILGAFLISTAGAFTASSPLARAGTAAAADPDPDYDRLDGKGRSGKKVDVIEWEGNLEVHVYPAGSLKGLAMKLDKRNKDKPVMVIGYRFDNDAKSQLIRRAILGIDLREGFKAFRDPSAKGYDKIIISNNGLSGSVLAYQLEPAPTQLYPDGHPALARVPANENAAQDAWGSPAASIEDERRPASTRGRAGSGSTGPEGREERPASKVDEESGTIQPFYMREGYLNRR